jgi:rubrerythrin
MSPATVDVFKKVIADLDPPAKAGRTRQEKLEDDYALELAQRQKKERHEQEREKRERKRARERKRRVEQDTRPRCPTCGHLVKESA